MGQCIIKGIDQGKKKQIFFFLIFIWNGKEMGKVMDQGMIQGMGMVKNMEKGNGLCNGLVSN